MMPRRAHCQFGSKARVAADLLELVPPDVMVWVEGFAGTAAVTLAKPPHPAEHLNDANGEIVNLFRVLRDGAARERLCSLVELTPYAEAEFRDCCSAVWGGLERPDDPVERARQFLVASWQAIGGKQRVKSSWRLDLGRSWLISTWQGVPDRLWDAATRLKAAHIHQKHIRDLVEMFSDQPQALLFLDPPYPRRSISAHEPLYANDMTEAEHAERRSAA
jgi:DNA adenine methylase